MEIRIGDAHCDFLYFAARGEYKIDGSTPYQKINIDRLKAGNVALQFFAAWIDVKAKKAPLYQCLGMIAYYLHMQKAFPNTFVSFSNGTKNDNRIKTVLTIEGGEAIEDNPDNVAIFKKLGVSAMTLTWNYANNLASSAAQRTNKGLTNLGKEVITRMVEERMAIDLAHLSDAGIDDVLELTQVPVFSSHTNARGSFDSRRSMCDEHIKEVSKRGGVMGVNFFHEQLTKRGYATVTDIADQIEYIAKVGGIDCVAIGSDFDGMDVYPTDLTDSSKFPLLVRELTERGFTDSDIQKIMYDNLARFILQYV